MAGRTATDIIREGKVTHLVDQQCTEELLQCLSEHITDWQSVVVYLGFENSRVVIEQIQDQHRGKFKLQTRELLWKWLGDFGSKATYRKLIEVFANKLSNALTAEKICKLLLERDDGGHSCAGEQPDAGNDGHCDGGEQPAAGIGPEFLLIVTNPNEYTAVTEKFEGPITRHPITTHNVKLGKFGGCNVALFTAEQGRDCQPEVKRVLEGLTTVDKVIAVGVAGGAYKDKQKLGDVIVSTRFITGPVRFGPKVVLRGTNTKITESVRGMFCCDFGDSWIKEQNDDPVPSVHFGLVVSENILWDDKEKKKSLEDKLEGQKFVGCEMEGAFLREAAQEVNEKASQRKPIAVIVIKGISDWGDGTKGETKESQPIAAKHAASYTAHYLQKHADSLAGATGNGRS